MQETVIATEMLGPVIALIAWSMVIWFWMYATRLPAMRRAGMKPDPDAPLGEQMSKLPPSVRWKADNYNHLMEQPTIFYALAISLALMGVGGGASLVFAWAYVVLRVVHSLVQVLSNKVEVRFVLFILSNVPIIALLASALVSITS